jgi:hypothetical protein
MSYENAPATKMLAVYCACCSRPLVDAVSVETGIGPDCRKQHAYTEAQGEPDWRAVLEHTDGLLSVEEILASRGRSAMTPADVLGAFNLVEATWRLGGVETRRVANLIVYRIAVQQSGPQVVDLTNALRALGYAKLAGRIALRLARVTIEAEGNFLYVDAPLVVGKVDEFRQIPGRYRDKARGRYGADRIPATSKRPLFDALKRLYPGTVACGPKGLFTL